MFTSLCIPVCTRCSYRTRKDSNACRSGTNSYVVPFQERCALMLTQTKHNKKTTGEGNIYLRCT